MGIRLGAEPAIICSRVPVEDSWLPHCILLLLLRYIHFILFSYAQIIYPYYGNNNNAKKKTVVQEKQKLQIPLVCVYYYTHVYAFSKTYTTHTHPYTHNKDTHTIRDSTRITTTIITSRNKRSVLTSKV